MRYRRNREPGGCYFFTVVTAGRRPWLGRASHVECLRAAFRSVRARHPFRIEAMVVLPDHLHTLWTLPAGDMDYSRRWRLIKTYMSRRIEDVKPLWQPRFWEHTIRDADDFARHMDYIHYNPVRHGLVAAPSQWPHSSFARCVRAGRYAADWGQTPPDLPSDIGRE